MLLEMLAQSFLPLAWLSLGFFLLDLSFPDLISLPADRYSKLTYVQDGVNESPATIDI